MLRHYSHLPLHNSLCYHTHPARSMAAPSYFLHICPYLILSGVGSGFHWFTSTQLQHIGEVAKHRNSLAQSLPPGHWLRSFKYVNRASPRNLSLFATNFSKKDLFIFATAFSFVNPHQSTDHRPTDQPTTQSFKPTKKDKKTYTKNTWHSPLPRTLFIRKIHKSHSSLVSYVLKRTLFFSSSSLLKLLTRPFWFLLLSLSTSIFEVLFLGYTSYPPGETN
jgi:hypothetical protein